MNHFAEHHPGTIQIPKPNKHAQQRVPEAKGQLGVPQIDVGVDSGSFRHCPPPLAELEEGNVGLLVEPGGVGGAQEEDGLVEVAVEAEAAEFLVGGGFLLLVEGELGVGVGREGEASDGLEGLRGGGERGGEESAVWVFQRDCCCCCRRRRRHFWEGGED